MDGVAGGIDKSLSQQEGVTCHLSLSQEPGGSSNSNRRTGVLVWDIPGQCQLHPGSRVGNAKIRRTGQHLPVLQFQHTLSLGIFQEEFH